MNIKVIAQNIANNPGDFSAEELEKLFEDYANFKANQNPVAIKPTKKRERCHCGNPIDYSNPDCVTYSLCKGCAMDA